MSDVMHPIPFAKLIHRIFFEYKNERNIFGIPDKYFYYPKSFNKYNIYDEYIDTPLGPAAGPHTQLTQNIIAAYLAGGRFFELKTVQVLDALTIDKPCIDATDECYNVEWSQELNLTDSHNEYLKAWIILHLLNEVFHFNNNKRGFVFNMSVGYNLEGIKSAPMDNFINGLTDASASDAFNEYKNTLINYINNNSSPLYIAPSNVFDKEKIIESIKNISPCISNSVTLSTMHGCPPEEIDSIARYLIKEKHLNTYVKLNPTLLGYDTVRNILDKTGYTYIELDKSSFENDLKINDAIPMLKGLQAFSKKHNKIFGIKLSNTLGTINTKNKLAGKQMYMSGRSLFPLTINLASALAEIFDGNINISYSGGASVNNIKQIISAGIFPVTLVTDLLKPGGYLRLKQMSELSENINNTTGKIDIEKLKILSEDSLANMVYKKETRETGTIKTKSSLGLYDCFISPCSAACPVHQDVSEYISLIENNNYAEAFKVIVSKNPLPNITGYICDHQCMSKCTRWDYDAPVSIRELKKEAAIKGYTEYLKLYSNASKQNYSHIKAAIIGAGPAGLSAAYFLSKCGLDVTVFDKSEKAGGTVQHTIPAFRLPQEAIDKDVELIKQQGVKFIFNCDSNFSIEQLKNQGYKYIFIGIGAEISNKLNITGNKSSVYEAVDFLKSYNNNILYPLGKKTAVIGGGNSAMDAARAALKMPGVKDVFIIYRRTKEFMPADMEELNAALSEGAQLKELLLPVDFNNHILKCQKMILDKLDSDGRRNVTASDDKYEYIEADSIISAIGENVDMKILADNNLLAETVLKLSPDTNETQIENVFIGGDAARGPSTVIESVADGKMVADAIIKKENIIPDEDDLISHDIKYAIEKATSRKGIVYERKVELNNNSRCLNCNMCCNKCVDVCPNRANVAITVTDKNIFKDAFQILHIDSYCNECGNCETFCPHNGAPYKDKITLFANESEFTESNNNGFYIKDKINKNYNIVLKLNSKFYDIVFDDNDKSISGNSSSDNVFAQTIETIKTVIAEYNYLL